jgi:hypothetical protein
MENAQESSYVTAGYSLDKQFIYWKRHHSEDGSPVAMHE